MAKKYTWEVEETLEEGGTASHTVTLCCSMISGKAKVSIDGDEYDISTKPFALRGTEQVFRLGEAPAVLTFPKKGQPTLTYEDKTVSNK